MGGDLYGGSRRADGHDRTDGGGHPYGSPSTTGEYDPLSGEYRTVGGGSAVPGGVYGGNAYTTDPYGGGAYRTPTGEYPALSGEQAVRSGEYGTRSGEYGTRTGEYRARTGEYRSRSGEHRRGQHAPGRRSSGSGGYRSGTGSHRIVRERGSGGRRLALLLAGVAAGVGACVLAAFAILSGVGAGERRDAGQVVGSGSTETTPSARGERTAVPDACELLDPRIADKLAPNADRTQAANYQSSDRQNQCVWGAYTGHRKRQLTIELRAVDGAQGRTPTDTAVDTFRAERKADESGKALLAGQKLTEKKPLEDLGNDGYLVYSVDEGQGSGEAVANVRSANVLITVHYSGGNDGKPLGAKDAMNGATEAVRSVLEALSTA